MTTTLDRFEHDAFDTLSDVVFGSILSSGCGDHKVYRSNSGKIEMSVSFAVLLLKRYQRDCTVSRPTRGAL